MINIMLFFKIISLYFFVLLLLSQEGDCNKMTDFTRKVSLFYNPGCNYSVCNPDRNSSVNLIYARSQGANDSLHYILSTVGPSSPTLLLLRSNDVTASLKVDWDTFLNNRLDNITGSIKLVVKDGDQKAETNVENVVIFDKLLEYNDSSDEADIDTSKPFPSIPLSQLTWKINITGPAESTLYGTTSDLPHSFSNISNVSLNFLPLGSDGRSTLLPALPHNANSSEWEVNLNSLLSRGKGSRFGVQMMMLASDSNVTKSRLKSIDDEYAPTIFTMEKLMWGQQFEGQTHVETFAQWRAVSYNDPERLRKYSTDVKTTDFKAINETSKQLKDILDNRLLCAYFGLEKLQSLSASSIEVSFGQTKDGFYAKTNFTSWTSTIGFGVAPVDTFSTLIICMLFAGVACPILVIIAGGIYVTYLRVKRSKRSNFRKQLATNYDYQPID